MVLLVVVSGVTQGARATRFPGWIRRPPIRAWTGLGHLSTSWERHLQLTWGWEEAASRQSPGPTPSEPPFQPPVEDPGCATGATFAIIELCACPTSERCSVQETIVLNLFKGWSFFFVIVIDGRILCTIVSLFDTQCTCHLHKTAFWPHLYAVTSSTSLGLFFF